MPTNPQSVAAVRLMAVQALSITTIMTKAISQEDIPRWDTQKILIFKVHRSTRNTSNLNFNLVESHSDTKDDPLLGAEDLRSLMECRFMILLKSARSETYVV